MVDETTFAQEKNNKITRFLNLIFYKQLFLSTRT